MANIFSKLLSKKARKFDAGSPFSLVWTGGGFSMISNNVNTYIREGYNGNSAVYAVINALMQKFAQVPFYVYKVKSAKQLNKYKTLSSHYNSNSIFLKAQALDEVSENDPLQQFMMQPNKYQSDTEFRMMALMYLKTTGMAPIYANTGLVGTKPLSMHVLPAQWVTLVPDESLMDVKTIYFSPMGAGVGELAREKVHLWKYQNPDIDVSGSHLYGLSPLKAGLKDVQSSNEAAIQMAKMYQNGGARGVLTPKEPINEVQVNGLRGAIEAWLSGSDNRGKVGGLGTPVEFHAIGLDAVDMKLLEGKQITDERIASIFNYPPALLKSDNKYDNVNAAVKYVVTNSLYADLVAYRNMWNNWLVPMFGLQGQYFIDFDISVLPELQEDMKLVVEQADKMWWITPNEKRQLSSYDTLKNPGMDSILVPSGFTPIEDLVMGDVQLTQDYANNQ